LRDGVTQKDDPLPFFRGVVESSAATARRGTIARMRATAQRDSIGEQLRDMSFTVRRVDEALQRLT